MAFSTQRAVSDGTMSYLDISIKYISRDDISVFYDGLPADPDTWAWVGTTETRISFTPNVPNGVEVLIARTTRINGIINVFALGAKFNNATMDLNFTQLLYLNQEAVEGAKLTDIFNDVDFHGYKIKNLGAGVASGDATNLGQVQTMVASVVSDAAAAASGFADASSASATASAASATSAATSASLAAASYDSFDDRYLGAKSTDPVTDNDGDAILEGALYWNTPSAIMKVWHVASSSWLQFMTFLQTGVGAVFRNVQDKQREQYKTPEDYGAVGNDTADDTVAIQKMLDAADVGETVYFPHKYKLTGPVYVRKALRLLWPNRGPYSIFGVGSYVRQATAGVDAFVLVPQAPGVAYAFGYGITDVHFENPRIRGLSIGSRGNRGIGVDTSVNSGDYHVRNCTVSNPNISYFTTGIDFTGIAYLNHFYNVAMAWCDVGVKVARGTASDAGGQTRFFGGAIVSCTTCLSLNEDTSDGSFSVYGMTLSESQYGIRTNEEANLTVVGCEFETLVNSGDGAGIYIPIVEANPTTTGVKTIHGNKFLSSDSDIWINKTAVNGADGTFHFPVSIEGNYFGSSTALRISVPGGHMPMSSQAFVFGEANAGPTGPVTASQISTNFNGTKMWRKRITRRYTFNGSTVSGQVLDSIPVGTVMLSARVYLTANASGFTQIQIGDQANATRYAAFNAQTQPLNTWINWTSAVPELIIDGTDNKLTIIGTAGILGATGVIEIDGFIAT